MKIKAVLFARVSTRDQAEEGYSLPAQEKLLKEYALKNDLLVRKKFSVPESARGKQERKLFNELVGYVYEHPEVKVVVCEKVDRITRNLKDAVKLNDWLNEDEERQIHFVKQNLVIHKNSRSHEKFQWDIYLALARQYSNNLSEETKKGLYEKAEQGWYPGNKKRGYKTIGDAGHKIWMIDSESPDSRFIPKAFELYASQNFTVRKISKELFNQGWMTEDGRPISPSEIHRVLRDCFYCGEFVYGGKHYKDANHPPLVTKELFCLVQELIERKVKAGKYFKHTFLFGGGLIVCGECNRTVTGEVQKGHHYYHCTRHNNNCSQRRYLREELIEDQVLEILNGFVIKNKRLLEWVRKALKESHQDEKEYHSSVMEDLEKERRRVERRLDLLYDERIDGKIDKGFYERKRDQYEEQLERISEAISKHTKANIDYKRLGINIFELSQIGKEIYEKDALPGEKKDLLRFIFSNLKLKDEKLYPTYKNGFQVVAKHAESGDWLGIQDDFRTLEWISLVQNHEQMLSQTKYLIALTS